MNKIITIMLFFSVISFSKNDPLSIWIMPNGANPQGILEDLLVDFTRQTNIETEVTVLDWGEAWTRIHDALESGEGPDILQLGTTWVPYYADKGWLETLNKYQERIDFNRFIETSMTTTKIMGDETIVAVPWFIDSRVLIANKRVLDEVGVKPNSIRSYKDFVSVLSKIKQRNIKSRSNITVTPYEFPGKSDWNIPHNFAPWIWSEGGSIIDINENNELSSNLMDPKTILGIRKYIGFVMDSLASASSLQENTSSIVKRFNNGEVAFIVGTSEIIMQTRISQEDGGLKESAIGFDGLYTIPIPAGPAGSVSFVGGSNLCIPKAIERPTSSVELKKWREKNSNRVRLLQYLTNPNSLDSYTSKIGLLPPDKDVLSKWQDDKTYVAVIKGAETGRYYPNIARWGDIESILVEMFSEIWSLVDETGYYTETNFYDILVKYNEKVNKKLNSVVIGERVISLDEFISLVNSINPKPIKKVTELSEIEKAYNFELFLSIISFLVVALIGVAIYIYQIRKEAMKEYENKK